MFGKKKGLKTKPVEVDRTIYKIIGNEWNKIPPGDSDHWVKYMAVMRPQKQGSDVYDIRVFNQWYAQQNKIRVFDYAALDNHSELVLFEGWFDIKTKKGEIKYKPPVFEKAA